MDVKICGLKDAASVDAALAGGARYVGLMFVAKSPRNISLAEAGALAARMRGRADIVAVTADASDDLLKQIAAAIRPDWIQVHGGEPPARTAQARAYARKGVIKALGIATAEDLAGASAFAQAANMLLLDAKPPPGADRSGGHGAAYDWTLLQGGRAPRMPWMLSGGLNPENVAEAIRLSGAAAVDVSSGVEQSPGVKDAEKITAFLAAAGARRAAL